MKKQRIVYAAIFALLLLVEIGIALFVHDRFIRPYFGDVLVTVLLCCLCRVVIPKGMPLLPVYVFLFAVFVELTQYFDLVGLLGWEDNTLMATIMGRSFSLWDIVCYGAGCFVFWIVEKVCISCGSRGSLLQ
jgi:hypothetical protein